MPALEIEDPAFKFEFVDGGMTLSLMDLGINNFLESLGLTNAVTPIKEFKVTLVSGNHYVFRLELVDGRIWSQELFLEGSYFAHTKSTFNIPEPWSTNEVIPNRRLREAVDILLRKHGLVKIEVVKKPA